MDSSVAVIGCGPAGAACAIQLKRSGLEPVVYEYREAGGTIRMAHLVENYLGFPEGIAGRKLAALFCTSLEKWNVNIVPEKVGALSQEREAFTVGTADSMKAYRCVVVATGTRPRRLDGTMVDRRVQDRVMYDVLALKERGFGKVGILGGGDVAMDYALHLSADSEVHVFFKSSKPRALALLTDRAVASGITLHETGPLVSVEPAGDSLELVFEQGGFIVDALLPSIGRGPVTDFIEPDILKRRTLLREERKVYFIGDVANGPYRQVAIAAGEGLRAAMEVLERWS
jgi:thioredoxin reductase (NADPH)